VFTISHSATHTDAHTHTPRAARFKAQCGTSARQRYRSTREIERIRSLCARHSTPRLHVWNDAHRRVCAARGVAQCRRCTRSRTRSSFAHTCEVCVRDMAQHTPPTMAQHTHCPGKPHLSRADAACARTHNKSAHLSRARFGRSEAASFLSRHAPRPRACYAAIWQGERVWNGGGCCEPAPRRMLTSVSCIQQKQSNGLIQPALTQRAPNADSMCAAALCSFSATVQSCSRRERLPATCIGGGRWKVYSATGAGRMSSSSSSSSS